MSETGGREDGITGGREEGESDPVYGSSPVHAVYTDLRIRVDVPETDQGPARIESGGRCPTPVLATASIHLASHALGAAHPLMVVLIDSATPKRTGRSQYAGIPSRCSTRNAASSPRRSQGAPRSTRPLVVGVLAVDAYSCVAPGARPARCVRAADRDGHGQDGPIWKDAPAARPKALNSADGNASALDSGDARDLST